MEIRPKMMWSIIHWKCIKDSLSNVSTSGIEKVRSLPMVLQKILAMYINCTIRLKT